MPTYKVTDIMLDMGYYPRRPEKFVTTLETFCGFIRRISVGSSLQIRSYRVVNLGDGMFKVEIDEKELVAELGEVLMGDAERPMSALGR